MMSLMNSILDAQYRRPSGLIGRWVGRRMARQHRAENAWTVSLLDAQPTDQILEVGFGPGIALEMLACVVTQGRITGVDASTEMVATASRRNRAAIRAGRVELRQGEAASLLFSDATFDKAYSIHSIYFWPNTMQGLCEMRRVLKPGGRLVVTILPKERWPVSPDGTLGTPDCHVFGGDELARLMREAGFASTAITDDPARGSASNYSIVGWNT
jgi:SAM-dependent methyltransferase